jgi:hypothetical protein
MPRGATTQGRLQKNLARDRDPCAAELHWAAGVYEGEGSCSASGATTTVQVEQKDDWLLHRLRTLFGGSVRPVHRPNRVISQWVITGARARGFLMTIYGLLSPRRQRQVRIALGKE